MVDEMGLVALSVIVAISLQGCEQPCRRHPIPDVPLGPGCAADGPDCRPYRCCQQDGAKCFAKDTYWAACLRSCTQGILEWDDVSHKSPWDCTDLSAEAGNRTPRVVRHRVPVSSPRNVPRTCGAMQTKWRHANNCLRAIDGVCDEDVECGKTLDCFDCKNCPEELAPMVDVMNAAQDGDFTKVERMLGQGDICEDAWIPDNSSLLSVAARAGHVKFLRDMLDLSASPNNLDSAGKSPVVDAARNGHEEILGMLCKAGAFIDLPDVIGRPPLHLAAELDDLGAVDLLLNFSASLETRSTNNRTVLHRAAFNGSRVLRRLLDLPSNLSLHVADQYGHPPLDEAAAKNNSEAVALLIERDADVNRLNFEGRGPLFWAVTSGLGTVKILLEAKASPDQPDSDGVTPIHRASKGYPGEGDPVALITLLLNYSRDGLLARSYKGRKSAYEFAMLSPRKDLALYFQKEDMRPTTSEQLLYAIRKRDFVASPPVGLALGVLLGTVLAYSHGAATDVEEGAWLLASLSQLKRGPLGSRGPLAMTMSFLPEVMMNFCFVFSLVAHTFSRKERVWVVISWLVLYWVPAALCFGFWEACENPALAATAGRGRCMMFPGAALHMCRFVAVYMLRFEYLFGFTYPEERCEGSWVWKWSWAKFRPELLPITQFAGEHTPAAEWKQNINSQFDEKGSLSLYPLQLLSQWTGMKMKTQLTGINMKEWFMIYFNCVFYISLFTPLVLIMRSFLGRAERNKVEDLAVRIQQAGSADAIRRDLEGVDPVSMNPEVSKLDIGVRGEIIFIFFDVISDILVMEELLAQQQYHLFAASLCIFVSAFLPEIITGNWMSLFRDLRSDSATATLGYKSNALLITLRRERGMEGFLQLALTSYCLIYFADVPWAFLKAIFSMALSSWSVATHLSSSCDCHKAAPGPLKWKCESSDDSSGSDSGSTSGNSDSPSEDESQPSERRLRSRS